MSDKLLARFTREMRGKYKCHTLILYGSRARGEATPVSDYDLLAFRTKGKAIHDARKIAGVYLDAFIYPEKLAKADDNAFHSGYITMDARREIGGRYLTVSATMSNGLPCGINMWFWPSNPTAPNAPAYRRSGDLVSPRG